MAMVASKVSYMSGRDAASGQAHPAALRSATVSNHRNQAAMSSNHGNFASPTESEFSDVYDGPDSVRYVGI